MKVLKRRLPLGAVGLLLVLLLAVTGVVYGNWSQKLTINGNVQTGEINAKWLLAGDQCFDDAKDAKGQATTKMSLAGDKLTISVDNAFPFYGATCFFQLQNSGKMPLELANLNVIEDSGLTNCVLDDKAASSILVCDEASLGITNGAGQLDQGQIHTLSIRVDVSKQAQPGATYVFQASACVEIFGTDQCASKFPKPVIP